MFFSVFAMALAVFQSNKLAWALAFLALSSALLVLCIDVATKGADSQVLAVAIVSSSSNCQSVSSTSFRIIWGGASREALLVVALCVLITWLGTKGGTNAGDVAKMVALQW